MNWISKLERKFGRYAIQNLMFYVIALYTVGFALSLVAPEFYYQVFVTEHRSGVSRADLEAGYILMQPPSSSALFMVFALYLYYMIGMISLMMVAFRFNLYFLTVCQFYILVVILVYVIGTSFPLVRFYLNLSLFFAFAALYPNEQSYCLW